MYDFIFCLSPRALRGLTVDQLAVGTKAANADFIFTNKSSGKAVSLLSSSQNVHVDLASYTMNKQQSYPFSWRIFEGKENVLSECLCWLVFEQL